MIELASSILAADFAHLAGQVERATAGGASVIHGDIMEGHFVPNLTIGPPVVKSLRQATEFAAGVGAELRSAGRGIAPSPHRLSRNEVLYAA
ncbi:MAG: hypothetical protein ABR920_10300 [Terriglobales bacterium]